MKSTKSFFFLHFIILSYIIILSSSLKPPPNPQCPNYSLLKFCNDFVPNNSMSLSIWTKEFLFSDISKRLSDFSYFMTTSKSGIISVVSDKKILFSLDLNKKMYKSYFHRKKIIAGDNDTLPLEGRLFRVYPDEANLEENLGIDNFEMEKFEEITTPIRDLADTEPFSFWFSKNYFFNGDKKYSIVKIINRNRINNLDINLDEIILVDYNLNCLNNEGKVWNATVTNAFFIGENEKNLISNKNFKIEEDIIIFENNFFLEKFMKENFGNNYNDISYIYGYDKIKKKYFKVYDYNTYIHIKKNNIIIDLFEEQNMNHYLNNNDEDIINAFDFDRKINIQYDFDFIIYYIIVVMIIIWAIALILNSFIYKTLFSLQSSLKNIFSKKGKNKLQKNNSENNNLISQISHEEIFSKIKNYFNPKTKHKESLKLIRTSLSKDIKSIKIKEHSNSTEDLLSELNKDFALFPSAKAIIKRNSNILRELGIANEKTKSDSTFPTRLEKDFKEIIPLKKSVFRNSIDVILRAKHKIDEQLYAIKIKKLTNPNEEQSIIAEAQNMKKIRSKHIVEYITCWLDSSVGNLEYLFKDKMKKVKKIYKKENNDDIFFSSKSNSKVAEKNTFKTFISNDDLNKEDYVKQLYTKRSESDGELTPNIKEKINIEKKFYKNKETEEEKVEKEENISNNNKTDKKQKRKSNFSSIDDSFLTNLKSENQKNISDLSIYFFIQMEFCQQMTLAQYMEDHSKIKISNKVIYTFTYQLIKSLAKIHSKNIIHANINPENIFVINEDSIKIGDFSSAKDIELKFKKIKNKYDKLPQSQSYQNLMEIIDNEEIETNHREESLYSSPEQNKGSGVSKKSDIYSVGLVLYEMCECFSDHDRRNKKIKYLKKYKTFENKFQKNYDLQCNLILQMIEDDEDKRPSCEELLESKEMQTWKLSINEN